LRVAGIAQPLSELGEPAVSGLRRFGPTQNNIQIDYFGVALRAGESLRYQYKLEGALDDWSAPATRRSVDFANLAPGAYRFLVRAISTDGTQSASPAVVAFEILPPVWERWWFLAIAASLILGAVAIVARARYKRLKAERESEEALRRNREERLAELERVRKRIATDLHDDIGSSLTRISLLSEVARQQVARQQVGQMSQVGRTNASLPPASLDAASLDAASLLPTSPDPASLDPESLDPASLEPALSSIAALSRELVDSMSDIVWAINPSKDHLSDLSQRMRHFVSDLCTARQIDFRFRTPSPDYHIALGANLRREVFLVFKEAVNNMVRHSGCTEADLEFRADEQSILLRVGDNGRGFDAACASAGHGLRSMRERAEALGGRCDVRSHPGRGTVVTFSIPLAARPPSARGPSASTSPPHEYAVTEPHAEA